MPRILSSWSFIPATCYCYSSYTVQTTILAAQLIPVALVQGGVVYNSVDDLRALISSMFGSRQGYTFLGSGQRLFFWPDL